MIEDPNLSEDVYNKLKECGLKIGLTGQICCGKSTFIKYFKQYDSIGNYMGVDVFDLQGNSTDYILQKIFKWQKDQKLNLEQLSARQWQNSLQFLDIQQLMSENEQQNNDEEEEEKSEEKIKENMKKLLGENNIQELEEQLIEISKSYNSKEKNNGQAKSQLIQQLQKQLVVKSNGHQIKEGKSQNQNGKQENKQKLNNGQSQQEIEKIAKIICKELNQNQTLEDSMKTIFPTSFINPIVKSSELKLFKNKINFHLICIEAPIHKRWERFQVKYAKFIQELKMDFEKFAILDDFITYNTDLHNVMAKANYRICYSSFEKDFFQKIENSIDEIIRPYRPTWDQYFITMAYALKARSNCVRESVGSVLVKDKRIIGAGYNGTPSNSANCFEFGCNDCRQHPMGKPQLDKCICLHAEEASILEAGINMSEGCTLYTTQFPCIWCAKCIVQAKLKRVVYNNMVPGSEESQKILQKYVKIDQVEYVDRLFHSQ